MVPAVYAQKANLESYKKHHKLVIPIPTSILANTKI